MQGWRKQEIHTPAECLSVKLFENVQLEDREEDEMIKMGHVRCVVRIGGGSNRLRSRLVACFGISSVEPRVLLP
jgi:hypothetical protein